MARLNWWDEAHFVLDGVELIRTPIEGVALADGTTLDGFWVVPTTGLKAVLYLGHAMMVDIRTLDRPLGGGLVSHLARRGIGVAALNFRGHTRTGPRAAPRGYSWTYDDLVLIDVPGIVSWLKARADGLPLFIGGHSLAGHTSLAALGAGLLEGISGWVGIASNVWLPQHEPSRRRWLRKRSAIEAFGAVSRLTGRFDSSLWRMGPVPEALPYVLDLRRFARTGHWGSRDGQLDYLAGARALSIPVLYITGDSDLLMGHPAGVRGFMQGVGRRQQTIHIHDAKDKRADHMGVVLHPDFAQSWNQIASWILNIAQT